MNVKNRQVTTRPGTCHVPEPRYGRKIKGVPSWGKTTRFSGKMRGEMPSGGHGPVQKWVPGGRLPFILLHAMGEWMHQRLHTLYYSGKQLAVYGNR